MASIKTLYYSISLFTTAFALPHDRRDDPTSSVKDKTFDYVIVGGGLTGLVVANRLSEQQDRTVLVIENGYIDDSPTTQIPQFANINNYADMYNLTSAPEPFLRNATSEVNVGNVVGGGSIVNGMMLDRASAADYDAWEELGNEGWNWENLLYYFKKSTTFTPPKQKFVKEYGITYDASYYGKSGPLQASFPNFEYPDMKTMWNSYRAEGIPLPKEHASGEAVGALWVPNSLQQKTQTRSHARNAYYDPVKSRPNLKLLTGQTVNEILFDGLKAKGVQFISRSNKTTTKVYAKREVILAAGAIFTPHILQLSGIGPKSILQAAGVKVKKDFPGVGANFQDHANTVMFYDLKNLSFPNPFSLSQNTTYNTSAWEEYQTKKTGPYTYAHGSSLAFLPLPHITKTSKSIVQTLRAQNATSFLPPIYSSSKPLLKGYEAQKRITSNLLLGNDTAAGEIPITAFGISIAAIQKPLSRGTITLNPSNPSGNPIIQFNAFQNPVDRAIFLALVRWTRNHWSSKELSGFSPAELVPGVAAQTDEQLMDALLSSNSILPSFAHQSGSCAMMPEELGGVVGSDLLVHGVEGLSIVDASIIPLIPATHLQATMYAVGEKAADLIKGRDGGEGEDD